MLNDDNDISKSATRSEPIPRNIARPTPPPKKDPFFAMIGSPPRDRDHSECLRSWFFDTPAPRENLPVSEVTTPKENLNYPKF